MLTVFLHYRCKLLPLQNEKFLTVIKSFQQSGKKWEKVVKSGIFYYNFTTYSQNTVW